jgi:hypothetical protein
MAGVRVQPILEFLRVKMITGKSFSVKFLLHVRFLQQECEECYVLGCDAM